MIRTKNITRSCDTYRKFRILHVDGLYDGERLGWFLDVANDLFEDGLLEPNQIEIELVARSLAHDGIKGKVLREVVIRHDLDRHVDFRLDCVQDASAVLFIQRGEWNGYIPERFFELLSLRKRILALVPNPAAYSEYSSPETSIFVVEGHDREGARKALISLYQRWHTENFHNVDQRTVLTPIRENADRRF